MEAAESILKYLALEAVPRDQQHQWVEDIPWHRVVQMVLDTLPRRVPLNEQPLYAYVVRLNRLLGVNFLH